LRAVVLHRRRSDRWRRSSRSGWLDGRHDDSVWL